MRLDPSGGLALVTDGSANYKDRSGGWAWIALDQWDGIEKGSGHQGDTTVNRMELMAPAQGLLHLATVYGACEVLIYSDSQYVVLGAMDRTRKRKTNHQFWDELDRTMEMHRYVEFNHVRGHNGHLWNEMVDQMAGEVRRKGVK